MNGHRPTKAELTSMTDEQLHEGLLADTTHASLYRAEILERRGRSNHVRPVARFIAGQNIRSLANIALHNESSFPLEGLATAILECGWDFIDPKGSMYRTPSEVVEFLESLRWRRQTYDSLNNGAKGLINTIVDACGRWCRQQS